MSDENMEIKEEDLYDVAGGVIRRPVNSATEKQCKKCKKNISKKVYDKNSGYCDECASLKKGGFYFY